MNYRTHQSEIRQSDQILKKLNEIKNAIDGGRLQSSPNNLNDYLPNQRLNSNADRFESNSNPLSYRRSLQKKLQKLFKEQKKGFYQPQPNLQYQQSNRFQSFIGIGTKDAFTIQKMENKIRQLQRKYLCTNPIYEQQKPHILQLNKKKKVKCKDISYQNQKNIEHKVDLETPCKKSKSIYQKQKVQVHNKLNQQIKKDRLAQKSDQHLLTQIQYLKNEVRSIKNSNVQLNEKIQHKQQQKKYKKQRSRYLLKCILCKLIQIQQEIARRDAKQGKSQQQTLGVSRPKTPLKDRQSLIRQNFELIKQVNQLNKQLKIEVSQKQIAQQRSRWIQDEIKKINRGY